MTEPSKESLETAEILCPGEFCGVEDINCHIPIALALDAAKAEGYVEGWDKAENRAGWGERLKSLHCEAMLEGARRMHRAILTLAWSACPRNLQHKTCTEECMTVIIRALKPEEVVRND